MKTTIQNIEQATLCPSYIELAKNNTPIKFESSDYISRACSILDSYYNRFMIGTNFKKKRIRQAFSEIVDQQYKDFGGDINKIDAEKILFDEFINCNFERIDKTSQVFYKFPIEVSVDYNHVITGTIDAIVEKQRRPRELQIIMYKNAPFHPSGNQISSSMFLKFVKSSISNIYNYHKLKNAYFIIYSFAPPGVKKIKLSSTNLRNFKNIAGRIVTSIEIGLLYPHPGRHCYYCGMRNCCPYRIHNSSSLKDDQKDESELLKFLGV